ncbi:MULTISPECIES: hypothetical protein [Sphingomonadaceae]|nr:MULTISPECIES: hypothetical protein [Sphingomonadaceae]MDK8186588.1 hypothetical protein [Sphingomonas zeae]MDK8216317.1 hypothetical protein [Sphingomonas sp. UMB7805-LC452B]
MRGADLHGLDWDSAVNFAQGWYAAHAGWPHRAPLPNRADKPAPSLVEAYDRGFADGGGDPSDLFDAARRANRVAEPATGTAAGVAHRQSGRLPISQWAAPSDQAPPVSWPRRLLVLSTPDMHRTPLTERSKRSAPSAFELARAGGREDLTILLLSARAGFTLAGVEAEADSACLTPARADELISDPSQCDAITALLAGRQFDDILVSAHGDYLRVIDAFSAMFPLCRTMARTRNSPLQQRAHLRTWLDRGRAPGTNIGAGHIRWSKVAQGLSAKLGEFVVRYAGPASQRGHLIHMMLTDGSLATGYVTAAREPLAPDIWISSKARLREEMTLALRRFGGATRLAGNADLFSGT